MPQPSSVSCDDRPRGRIVLIAHNIRSLWNIGSIFRAADAFGVEEVILSGYTAAPPRKEITKTAIGADAVVRSRKVDDALAEVGVLRSQGFCIASLETGPTAHDLHTFSLRPGVPVCLIVGHEILGVPEDLLGTSDVVLRIPMLGSKASLNVSVALGVALYQLRWICPSRPSTVHSS